MTFETPGAITITRLRSTLRATLPVLRADLARAIEEVSRRRVCEDGQARVIRGSIDAADMPPIDERRALLRAVEQLLGIADGPEDGGVDYG